MTAAATPPLAAYAAHKERQRRRQADLSRSGRDVGRDLPNVADPVRRAACERDFTRFCEAYFPEAFTLAWSDDHRRVISRIEQAVLGGGLFAFAMPRGSGKTTLCECAVQWAALYGHRRFVLFIGSDETSAVERLDTIKTELDVNDLLHEDFPEVCHPIRALEGIANRCSGQQCDGERTHVEWTAKQVVLPAVRDSPASNVVLKVAGITGRIRGMKFTRPGDGRSIRPDLVIIDDPQTDESANSPSQSATRVATLVGAVLGLAGPGKKIAGVMPCTVIRRADMADRILDRAKYPQWQGERTKILYAMPTNEALWENYARLRGESFRAGNGGREATEFYATNRAAMDEGAVVAWPARHEPDEISALQNAMNLRLQDPQSFAAEYQNEPIEEEQASDLPDAAAIRGKAVHSPRGEVPPGHEHVVAYVDVQGKLLYYLLAAFGDGLAGRVIDYGTYPDQNRSTFTLRDARRTLQQAKPGAGLEGAIYAGLSTLVERLCGREWARADGAAMRVSKLLIDANWGESTDTVYAFSRETPHAAVVMPAHGRFVGASSRPWDQYQKRPGETMGTHWMIPAVKGRRAVRHALIDTNFWKSFTFARLATATGDRGSLTLFGSPGDHDLLADHLLAEYRVRTTGRDRTVDEWKLKPSRPDNHWLDCLTGCYAAASMLGVALDEARPVDRPRQRVSLQELRAARTVRRTRR